MLVHIGANRALEEEQIILLSSMENGLSPDMLRLISALRDRGLTEKLSDTPKTLILYANREGQTACILAPTGLRTLRERMGCGPLDGVTAAWQRGKVRKTE